MTYNQFSFIDLHVEILETFTGKEWTVLLSIVMGETLCIDEHGDEMNCPLFYRATFIRDY